MTAHRFAFFHSSAAHSTKDIGKRHVWVKMANPTVEALRQAFIAHPTRLRIGHELDDAGSLRDLEHPPDAMRHKRPWLKSVTVKGAASFFDSEHGEPPVRLEFSPDLTCVIGGSMTGKSTLLDGLRVYVGAPLPQDARTREQVTERAAERFLAGAAAVELDCPGSDPTASANARWPAVFYTQGELQRLAQDPEAVQNILARLDASETAEIDRRERNLRAHDQELARTASRLAEFDNELAEAEQALDRSLRAREELTAFSDAGIEDLNSAAAATSAWRNVTTAVDDILDRAGDLISSMNTLTLPVIATAVDEATELIDAAAEQLEHRWRSASEAAGTLLDSLTEALHIAAAGFQTHETRRDQLRVQVERALADRGFDGARINEFQALNAQAALSDSYRANVDGICAASEDLSSVFERELHARLGLVSEQRQAFDRGLHSIDERFGGRFAARHIDDGGSEPLAAFLSDLGQRGITRWWNDGRGAPRPSPQELLLATSDPRPLVIDQPEDELDNRFLFETLLPALNGLKGRRQVIVATHNANIVVNGDADQVIQLEAEAEHGHVVCAGAIEDPTVRNAIVQTVDGGDEAFRLRRLKYGF
ncbi:hypothetical protein [Candidatus Poriferisodalis sp.]|uniref:hypothetical protein n=1 Tax=Candidatus Poriferisodalis sp. TaxID=3101277 RepID=UPI003B01851A